MKKVIIVDKNEIQIYEGYCAGKSYLWNLFFGWRKTDKKNKMTYIIGNKAYNKIQDILKLWE